MRAKLFLLLLLPLLARAEPKLSAYDELCLYDNLCSRLRNSDGSKVEPKPAVKKLIETMADPVHDFAKLYGVDPRAVAGAILAENSMNVQMDDEIQNWIVKNNIWGSKAALKAGMTIGPGQINIEPAMAADQYIASLGIRPARSIEEITKLLLTPAGAAEYSAAILRQAQDAYKAEGIDISKRPDILVTLYNFGQQKMSYTDRAKETAKLKLQPRPNFFGMFVAENIKTVEDAIGWSPERGRYAKENTELYAPGSLGLVTDDIKLQTSPPSCSTEGAGDAGQWRARQSWEPFQSFTPRATKFIEVVGRGIDCQMREWLQVKTIYGELGWMPKSSLASVSKPVKNWRLAVSACGAPEKEDCLRKALDLYGQPKLDARDNKGKYFLTVKKNDPNDPVMPDIRTVAQTTDEDQCGYAKYPDLKKQYQSQLNPRPENQPAKSRVDLYSQKGKLDSQLLALKDLLGLKDEYQEESYSDDNSWGGNPYNGGAPSGQMFGWGGMSPAQSGGGTNMGKIKNRYVQKIEEIRRQFDSCLGPAGVECQSLKGEQELKKFLDTDLKKVKSLTEFKSLLKFDYYLIPIERDAVQAQSKRDKEKEAKNKQLKEKSDALVKSVRETCAPLESVLPDFYRQVKTAVDDMEPLYAQEEFSYILSSFQRTCEQASLVSDFRANGNKLFDGTTEFNCTYRERTGIEDFSLDFLAKMDLTSADYLDMLKGVFEEVNRTKRWAASRASQNAFWGLGDLDSIKQMLAACNYNPLATARAVEKLAKSPCVETILVKDMSLGKNIGGEAKARVVLDNSLEPNQVAFTMKNDCRTDILGRPRHQLPFNGGNKE